MKKVVVTGASRGIGESITSLFLKRNFEVIGTAVKSPFPDDWLNNELFTGIHSDLNNIDELRDSFKELFAVEKPDVLINNAGVFEACDFESSDKEWLENWDKTQSINLRSAALLCKWFTSMHIESGSEGVIINIASRAAYRGMQPQKAGWLHLPKVLHAVMAGRGFMRIRLPPVLLKPIWQLKR